MCNIAFVVLHYENLDDTKACIESLLKYIDGDDVHIVVVDNGSQKGKLSVVEGIYDRKKQLHFLYSKNNLGFAKGNNIGYNFAKYQLNAKIIILANNDLIFKQDDFVEKLKEIYAKKNFDIAGPQIQSLVDYRNQNPVPKLYRSEKDVNIRIIKYYILYFFSIFNIDLRLQKVFSKKVVEYVPHNNDEFQLHGACLIFANRYLKKYDGLFDKTFMYGEESILKCIIEQNQMDMCYFEELCVHHKEGASTVAIHGKGKKKRQFYYRWNIESCKILKELMSKNNNNKNIGR